MKRRIFYFLLVLALILTAMGPSTARAAFPYVIDYSTMIDYQNIGTAPTTTLSILLYDSPGDTTPTVVPQDPLAVNASVQVAIGSLVSGTFEGTAVMAADQPLAATLLQLPPNVNLEPRARNKPVSNGFSQGSANSLFATV